jgi:uncharacterized membrane protein
MYRLVVTVHVFAAIFWLGSLFFLAAVGAPVLRKVEPPELRQQLFKALGEAFRPLGWGLIGTLILTGILILQTRGMLSMALQDPAFWRSKFGIILAWKLAAVGLMIALQALHDFKGGPAASRMRPGSPEALKSRRQAALLARLSAFIGVLIIFLAVRLVRG